MYATRRRALQRTTATAVVLLAFLAFVLAAMVPQASAQFAPSLEGEALLSGTEAPGGEGFFDATCANGTMTFHAEGVAGGPYIGTFTESGRLTFDPATGVVTSFTASFTIMTADGTTIVSGTKELAPPIPNGSVVVNAAVCLETEDTHFFDFGSAFSYDATIHSTLLGSFRDQGFGDAIGQDFDFDAAGGPVASNFQEYFRISTGVTPVGGEGHVTGGGWLGDPSSGERVSFGFTANSQENTRLGGHCTVIDHATGTKIRCLTVETLAQTGTHATFTGQAEVDGVPTGYRIDVDDLSEPGTLDTFRIQTDSGYVAGGVLSGGNIQIHE